MDHVKDIKNKTFSMNLYFKANWRIVGKEEEVNKEGLF